VETGSQAPLQLMVINSGNGVCKVAADVSGDGKRIW
jgi:hypothetical protein